MRHTLKIYIVFSFLFTCISTLCIGQIDSVQTGIASYYASKFNGRKTSNGEIFRNDSLTAAHKKLPFGTLVKVTNLNNDSVVIVRINDRLPQNSKRSIDLTQAAAKQLNMMRAGIIKAKIEILPPVKKDTLLVAGIDTSTVDTLIAVKNDSLYPLWDPGRKGFPEGITRGFAKEGDCIIERVMVVKNGAYTAYVKKSCPGQPVLCTRSGNIITEEEFNKETHP